MAQFPRTEPEIDELAGLLLGGLRSRVDDFPSPPVPLEQLEASLDAYHSARYKAIEVSAQARLATGEKTEALAKLVSELKTNLRFAENACGYDHATLKALGWGGRRPKTPMAAPGQVEGMKIAREGPGWIELKWRKPREGGHVRAYRIERSRFGSEKWEIAGMATGTSVRLEGQERGVQLWYRAIAVNAVGEGLDSAVAEAVL